MTWKEHPDMTNPTVKRWIQNDLGEIISIVTGNSNNKLGIDGEIRCGFNDECFVMPCSLSVVSKMSLNRIVYVAERMHRRRLDHGASN